MPSNRTGGSATFRSFGSGVGPAFPKAVVANARQPTNAIVFIAWRSSWHYEYNYEKQFPYTPNVRGVRTDEWKYIRYPHGDGGPDRHKAELYNLAADPDESRNLIEDPRHLDRVKGLQAELTRLQKETGVDKDEMPIDAGIKKELPDLKIR